MYDMIETECRACMSSKNVVCMQRRAMLEAAKEISAEGAEDGESLLNRSYSSKHMSSVTVNSFASTKTISALFTNHSLGESYKSDSSLDKRHSISTTLSTLSDDMVDIKGLMRNVSGVGRRQSGIIIRTVSNVAANFARKTSRGAFMCAYHCFRFRI